MEKRTTYSVKYNYPGLYPRTSESAIIPFLQGEERTPQELAKTIQSNFMRDITTFSTLSGYGNLALADIKNIEDLISKNQTKLSSTRITPVEELNTSSGFKYGRRLGPEGKIGTPYVFTYRIGESTIEVIFKKSKKIDIFSNVYHIGDNPETADKFACIKNKTEKYNVACINTQYPVSIVGCSEYINEIIIGYILNDIFFPSLMNMDTNSDKTTIMPNLLNGKLLTDDDLGLSVFQIGYFQAKADSQLHGYNVMEKADNTIDKILSDMRKIDEIILYKENERITDRHLIMEHILLQIIDALDLLTHEYDFVHGDLKAGNVFYKIDPSYLDRTYKTYNKNSLEKSKHELTPYRSNIRIKIADYGKSSITYKNKRYYCEENKVGPITELYVKMVDINQSMLDSIQNKVITIGDKKHSTHTYKYNILLLPEIRHTGCTTFKTIDFYILMVSMCFQSVPFKNFCLEYNILQTLFRTDFDFTNDNPASVNTANARLIGETLVCEAFDLIRLLFKENEAKVRSRSSSIASATTVTPGTSLGTSTGSSGLSGVPEFDAKKFGGSNNYQNIYMKSKKIYNSLN
jgi:hypothetical protein